MRVLDPEKDNRTLGLEQWAHLRYIQDQCRKGTIDLHVTAADVADAMELMFGELRRTRTILEAKYLEGFNDGWDHCYKNYADWILTDEALSAIDR